jgi:hypothetical protein
LGGKTSVTSTFWGNLNFEWEKNELGRDFGEKKIGGKTKFGVKFKIGGKAKCPPTTAPSNLEPSTL